MFDELDCAGTLKSILQKEVQLLHLQLSLDEVVRDTGGEVQCPFYPWFRMKNSKGRLLSHLLRHHGPERRFVCSGTKQVRCRVGNMYYDKDFANVLLRHL